MQRYILKTRGRNPTKCSSFSLQPGQPETQSMTGLPEGAARGNLPATWGRSLVHIRVETLKKGHKNKHRHRPDRTNVGKYYDVMWQWRKWDCSNNSCSRGSGRSNRSRGKAVADDHDRNEKSKDNAAADDDNDDNEMMQPPPPSSATGTPESDSYCDYCCRYHDCHHNDFCCNCFCYCPTG